MQQNFQVNLEGIISLLSNHLYSSDKVFIRELLQNAVDAITARQQLDGDFQPKIEITFIEGDDEKENHIVFEDNGIGLIEEEVYEFLTSIGSSTKRGENIDRKSFIGQFGIGLLSCFMVTEEILMVTQSIKSDYALRWRGKDDGTYSLERIEERLKKGTTVYIKLKEEVNSTFQAKSIQKLLSDYGEMLHFPIIFNNEKEGTSIEINIPDNPLEMEFDNDEEAEKYYDTFGRNVFNKDFLAAIPIKTPSGNTTGVAFIEQEVIPISAKQSNRVYLKRMLVSDKIDNILPAWAFFIKAVINSKTLRPTASRERFYQDDYLQKTRKHLGRHIRNYLMSLRKKNPLLLQTIIQTHAHSMKLIAEHDTAFFKMIVQYLEFPTSMGYKTIKECLAHDGVVRHVYEMEAFKQIKNIAAAQDILVIHSRYENDKTLLQKLPEIFSDIKIQEMEVVDFLSHFSGIGVYEQKRLQSFLTAANHELSSFDCEVIIRKFEPKNIPTLYYLNSKMRWNRMIDEAEKEAEDYFEELLNAAKPNLSRKSSLCFNYNNDLIQRLFSIKNEQLQGLYVRFLYVQALLLGNHSLNDSELKLFSNGLQEMINMHETPDKI